MSQGGRVLHAADGHVVLQLAHGRLVTIDCDDEALRAGDLVTLVGADVITAWSHPTGEFPDPLSSDRDLHNPESWSRLERRAAIIRTIRSFFERCGFLEVETPLVVPSPGTEVHLAPTTAMQSDRPGVTPTPRYLITSPEYHMKRLLAAGAPPIFQLCKTFRDGERGSHHRPEFTMLEWYRPWSTLETILEDCEALVRAVHEESTIRYQGRDIDLKGAWARLPFLGLLRDRAGIEAPEQLTTEEQLEAFATYVEPTLGRGRPEFVTQYPISMASLAQPCPSDPTVAERSELYIGGLEIANAFGELVDAEVQRQRCDADNAERRALGLPELPLDEDFLDALANGLPPSGGIALGVDRLVMLLTDAASIDDVVCF
jgi:elongation factor P--(R)-beta-lysine ligase